MYGWPELLQNLPAVSLLSLGGEAGSAWKGIEEGRRRRRSDWEDQDCHHILTSLLAWAAQCGPPQVCIKSKCRSEEIHWYPSFVTQRKGVPTKTSRASLESITSVEPWVLPGLAFGCPMVTHSKEKQTMCLICDTVTMVIFIERNNINYSSRATHSPFK